MKKMFLLLIIVLSSVSVFGQSFVSPVNFIETEANKQKVIAFIEKQVKTDLSAIGMDDASTLRMMEKENLDAFKALTKVTNISVLERVIKTYCEIGMCNYSTILMMYNEENKASNSKLRW